MAQQPTQTVTVDRISNSGNPIANQSYRGKEIHVPAGDPGDVLEVRLTERKGYYSARVVNTATAGASDGGSKPHANPPTPARSSPDLKQIADELCDQMLPIETREDSSDLGPNQYPGSEHRSTIASRHD